MSEIKGRPAAKSGLSEARLCQMYASMLRIRKFEERVAELLLGQPEIRCPVHLYTGQEAVAVGVCANLRQDDYVFSTHRSHGHYIAKGSDLKALTISCICRTRTPMLQMRSWKSWPT